MKFLGRLPFACVIAIIGGITTAICQFLIFESAWRSIATFCLTAAFGYVFSRWKLRRMNLPPDCSWTQFTKKGNANDRVLLRLLQPLDLSRLPQHPAAGERV